MFSQMRHEIMATDTSSQDLHLSCFGGGMLEEELLFFYSCLSRWIKMEKCPDFDKSHTVGEGGKWLSIYKSCVYGLFLIFSVYLFQMAHTPQGKSLKTKVGQHGHFQREITITTLQVWYTRHHWQTQKGQEIFERFLHIKYLGCAGLLSSLCCNRSLW